jgi:hypothetical protein
MFLFQNCPGMAGVAQVELRLLDKRQDSADPGVPHGK